MLLRPFKAIISNYPLLLGAKLELITTKQQAYLEFRLIPCEGRRGKVSRREIKFVKFGRRVLFRKEDLMELIEKCTVEPRPRREAE
jgi:hypothetical protein